MLEPVDRPRRGVLTGREGTTRCSAVIPDCCPGDEGGKDRSPSLINEIVREGARRLLAEVDAYIAALGAQRGEDGRRLLVRNGYHQSRDVLTRADAIEVTKSPGAWAASLAMAFKLIESARDRWRAVNAPHLVALVRAGALFRDGVLAERPEQAAA
jgi:hypothetical protein